MAEARAQKRSIQSSPRKMRLMLDMIRGKKVPQAISILHFTPNHASLVAEKTLRSAVANFQLKQENARYDIEDLYVSECYADGGAMLKRTLPAPMGRAFRMRKRSNHLTIVVSNRPPKGAIKDNTRARKRAGMAPKGAKPAAAGAATAAPKKRTKKTAKAAA
jgi:large subunit ribosomal protein L22